MENGPPRSANQRAESSMNQDPTNQEAAIAIISLNCQQSFEELYDALENAKWKLSTSAVEDELIRFRLWANNIGAAKKGRASLDYRLRYAAYLFQNVKSLLEDLQDTLKKGFIVPLEMLT